MSILYSIRKWLQESPRPVPEEEPHEKEVPESKRIPWLELHVYRSHTSNNSVTTIYHTNPSWQDMDSQAAMASACILQSEILATYKTFLSGDVDAVPYIHLADTIIRCDDITAIRAVVGWGKP